MGPGSSRSSLPTLRRREKAKGTRGVRRRYPLSVPANRRGRRPRSRSPLHWWPHPTGGRDLPIARPTSSGRPEGPQLRLTPSTDSELVLLQTFAPDHPPRFLPRLLRDQSLRSRFRKPLPNSMRSQSLRRRPSGPAFLGSPPSTRCVALTATDRSPGAQEGSGVPNADVASVPTARTRRACDRDAPAAWIASVVRARMARARDTSPVPRPPEAVAQRPPPGPSGDLPGAVR